MSANIYSHSPKIAVIITGFVGSSFALPLVIHGTRSKIVLTDVHAR